MHPSSHTSDQYNQSHVIDSAVNWLRTVTSLMAEIYCLGLGREKLTATPLGACSDMHPCPAQNMPASSIVLGRGQDGLRLINDECVVVLPSTLLLVGWSLGCCLGKQTSELCMARSQSGCTTSPLASLIQPPRPRFRQVGSDTTAHPKRQYPRPLSRPCCYLAGAATAGLCYSLRTPYYCPARNFEFDPPVRLQPNHFPPAPSRTTEPTLEDFENRKFNVRN